MVLAKAPFLINADCVSTFQFSADKENLIQSALQNSTVCQALLNAGCTGVDDVLFPEPALSGGREWGQRQKPVLSARRASAVMGKHTWVP